MVGWHHGHNGHEFEQTPGACDGQGGLVCCSPWGHKESDTTWRLNNNKDESQLISSPVRLFLVWCWALRLERSKRRALQCSWGADAKTVHADTTCDKCVSSNMEPKGKQPGGLPKAAGRQLADEELWF